MRKKTLVDLFNPEVKQQRVKMSAHKKKILNASRDRVRQLAVASYRDERSLTLRPKSSLMRVKFDFTDILQGIKLYDEYTRSSSRSAVDSVGTESVGAQQVADPNIHQPPMTPRPTRPPPPPPLVEAEAFAVVREQLTKYANQKRALSTLQDAGILKPESKAKEVTKSKAVLFATKKLGFGAEDATKLTLDQLLDRINNPHVAEAIPIEESKG